jgi:hypothetical protein
MAIEWREDSHEMDDYLDHKSRGLSPETITALDAALQMGFAETQAIIHVRTGRLRSSGRTESSVHDNVWTGEVIYGNEIADYAAFEYSRGNLHNFIRPLQDNPAIGVAFRTGVED